jgi:hypothetical protein
MKLRTLAVSLAVAGLASTAQAALIDRGNGLIYDSVLNVTWLQNANLAATQNFGITGRDADNIPLIDTDGSMSLDTARDWLTLLNAANYKGYSDWKLPANTPLNGTTFVETYAAPGGYTGANDAGYNITSVNSPLAHLFYVSLGNPGLRDTAGTQRSGNTGASYGLLNPGPFINMGTPQPSDALTGFGYWTGTNASRAAGYDRGWYFATRSGYQIPIFADGSAHVMVMRAGDVAAVPEPSSVAMLLGGLGLVGFMARRRRAA